MIRLAIDIGGTFTDCVLDVDGQRFTGKVLTTPHAPEEGFLNGARVALAKASLGFGDLDAVVHGTTLATNAIIERKGASPVLVTTQGFRDSLEIAYEHRFEQTDLRMVRPPALIPREDRYEVQERLLADGSILTPLDEVAVRTLAAEFAEKGVTAIALGFLHSYSNHVHERRAGDILAELLPAASISLSCDVSPEIREYDRISTTVANAYVRPLMESYLRRLEKSLAAEGFNQKLLIVTSSGGMTTLDTACRFPIRLVESGPAGGAILAKNIAAEVGTESVVSFDMGGTTAKICLIDDYRPLQSRSFEVARAYRFLKGSGIPLRIPVIEMVEIGAGGGSIAGVDDLSRLTVGPESASSNPGPACYGLGGDKPTVTDADLVLSRLDPDRFAGGNIKLHLDQSNKAMVDVIGTRLNLGSESSAAGISEIVDENMSNAARVHAVEWGKKLEGRAMIAFGGAAPLHAARLAEKCGIDRVIIPTGAGVGSAIGFLRAPIAYDVSRSFYVLLDEFDPARVNDLFGKMREEAEAAIRLGATDGTIVEERTAFMRYRGQGHEIDITIPSRDLTTADREELTSLFTKRYKELFGRSIPGLSHEIMTWRLSASIPVELPTRFAEIPLTSVAERESTRDIFDPDIMQRIPHGIYNRAALVPGMSLKGPAVIYEDDTSTLVGRNFDVRILASGYLSLERKS
ncbi:MAG: N-methylhydantoinase [Sphingomonadales bacterium]|nr:N-methylhydantoinase [Sphingomonadales bacterium]